MIIKNSLRDQFIHKNLYDILCNWNDIMIHENTYKPCIAYVVLQDNTISCAGNCRKCIEHLMNEVVPSQTEQRS